MYHLLHVPVVVLPYPRNGPNSLVCKTPSVNNLTQFLLGMTPNCGTSGTSIVFSKVLKATTKHLNGADGILPSQFWESCSLRQNAFKAADSDSRNILPTF